MLWVIGAIALVVAIVYTSFCFWLWWEQKHNFSCGEPDEFWRIFFGVPIGVGMVLAFLVLDLWDWFRRSC